MSEKTEMMVDMVKNLAILLTEQDSRITMEEALATVFNSETYRKIMDERTHFYHQSYYYVFAFLKEELTKGSFNNSQNPWTGKDFGYFHIISFFDNDIILVLAIGGYLEMNGEPGVKPHLSPYLPVFQSEKEKGESVKAKNGKTSPKQ